MATKMIINATTGERRTVELTKEELAHMEAMRQEGEAMRLEREAEEQAKADAKTSALTKLQALGLSEEEALALVGA
jgi:DNA-binding transcriptional regulator YhcF (GntR family)